MCAERDPGKSASQSWPALLLWLCPGTAFLCSQQSVSLGFNPTAFFSVTTMSSHTVLAMFFPSLSLHQSHQNLNFCLIFPPLLKLPSSWFSIIKAIAFPWGIWWYLSPLWSFTGWLSKQLLEPSIRHTITQCSFVQTSLGMFPISFLLELCMCASFPSLT